MKQLWTSKEMAVAAGATRSNHRKPVAAQAAMEQPRSCGAIRWRTTPNQMAHNQEQPGNNQGSRRASSSSHKQLTLLRSGQKQPGEGKPARKETGSSNGSKQLFVAVAREQPGSQTSFLNLGATFL